jgi:predicted nuclease of predicted toxin-antitoxin system
LGPWACWKVDDQELWDYAKANGLTIVSQDADFAEMAALLGPPPRVIWLRAGNQSTAAIATLLRRHAELILAFGNDDSVACLEIY